MPRPNGDAATDSAPQEALVERALAGDRGAWTALIERHDRLVMVSLLARGVPLERAREVTQETWARLIEQQRRGQLTRMTLPGLAITQARFLHLNHRRSERRHPWGAEPVEALDASAGVEERLLDRENLARASAALQKCSPSARRTFELIYQEPGLPYAAAAARLGLSIQRVRQIVCEVRQRIRAALEGES